MLSNRKKSVVEQLRKLGIPFNTNNSTDVVSQKAEITALEHQLSASTSYTDQIVNAELELDQILEQARELEKNSSPVVTAMSSAPPAPVIGTPPPAPVIGTPPPAPAVKTAPQGSPAKQVPAAPVQNQLTAENQKLTADKQQLETEHQQLTAENQTCQTELVTLKAKHQLLTAENQNCQTELVTLKSEITKLRNQINGVGQPPNQQLIQLNEQNKKLELELNNLKNTPISQSSSSLPMQITTLKAKIDDLITERNDLQNKINAQASSDSQGNLKAPPIAPGQPVAQGQPKGLLAQINQGRQLRKASVPNPAANPVPNAANPANPAINLAGITLNEDQMKKFKSIQQDTQGLDDADNWDGGGAEVLGGCMMMGLHRFLLIIIILILIFLIVLIFVDVSKCLVK